MLASVGSMFHDCYRKSSSLVLASESSLIVNAGDVSAKVGIVAALIVKDESTYDRVRASANMWSMFEECGEHPEPWHRARFWRPSDPGSLVFCL